MNYSRCFLIFTVIFIYTWLQLILHLLRKLVEVFFEHIRLWHLSSGVKAFGENKQSWFLFSSLRFPHSFSLFFLLSFTSLAEPKYWIYWHKSKTNMLHRSQCRVYIQNKFPPPEICSDNTNLDPRSVCFLLTRLSCLFSQPVSNVLTVNISWI